MSIIEVKQLSKRYRRSLAVNNADMIVNRGDILGLVGKNGAGKSTLLRIISGLSVQSSGTVALFGDASAQGVTAARRKIGTLIESPAFFPDLSAEANLNYYRIQRGVKDKQRIAQLLKLVKLEHAGKKKFKNFSLGMKQRLGIAVCLLHKPDILILDEPTNGLDPEGIVELRELLLQLNREEQLTILISSHILGELEHLATRYVFIDSGKIIDQISTAELKQHLTATTIIRTNDNARAQALLTQQFDCTVDNREERLYVAGVTDVASLTRFLFNQNLDILEVQPQSASLESFYLSLIGGNARD